MAAEKAKRLVKVKRVEKRIVDYTQVLIVQSGV